MAAESGANYPGLCQQPDLTGRKFHIPKQLKRPDFESGGIHQPELGPVLFGCPADEMDKNRIRSTGEKTFREKQGSLRGQIRSLTDH